MQIYLRKTAIIFLQILIFYCLGFSQTAEELYKRGKEHQSKREYQLAANAFSEAIKLKDDYAEAFFERGRTNQMSAGQYYPNFFPLKMDDPTVKSVFKDFQQAIVYNSSSGHW